MPRYITLTNLHPLYKDMRAKDTDRIKFSYEHGRIVFDVFFFIDETPFSLLFGAKQFNIAFELSVQPGFIVNSYLPDEVYKALVRALGLTYDPDHPFSTGSFLADFAKHIPTSISGLSKPEPHDIALYRSDVEEHEKIYFCGWRDNNSRGEKVTPRNLYKTRRLLGEKAYQICLRKNLSSCWTNDKSKSTQLILP